MNLKEFNSLTDLFFYQADKKKPSTDYIHTIKQAYKDCNLDLTILKKIISFYTLRYEVHW